MMMSLLSKQHQEESQQQQQQQQQGPSSMNQSSTQSSSLKQIRMREKAEQINLLLLQPDVDLWKLREYALTEGGLVNDTLRRRAWPKLVGLTDLFCHDENDDTDRDDNDDDIEKEDGDDGDFHNTENHNKIMTVSTSTSSSVSSTNNNNNNNKHLRKGTAPNRVTYFGTNYYQNNNKKNKKKNRNNKKSTANRSTTSTSSSKSSITNPGTAFTGGPFDQHDTMGMMEDDGYTDDSDDEQVMMKNKIKNSNDPAETATATTTTEKSEVAVAALAEDDTTSLASFDETNALSNTQQQQEQQSFIPPQSDNNNNDDDDKQEEEEDTVSNKIPSLSSKDYEQIQRDVTRCTWHLLTGGQRSRRRIMLNKHRTKISRILQQKQERLGDLINITLLLSEEEHGHEHSAENTNNNNNNLDSGRLCYYQGYHDVASIFLAALGGASVKALQQQGQEQEQQKPPTEPTISSQAATMGLELSSKVLYQVSISHFREPMRSNFLQLQTALRMVLLPLLRIMDPEVHAHLYGCGMEPFFALSWMLTWFSHDIRDTALVKRLFDFFLVSHPLMPIYLSVAMLSHPSNRQEILSTPCEFAELHHALSGLPKNSSMVGWKYRVGDGYVSDDEEVGGDGETTSISLDSDMASHLSGSDRGSTNRGSGPSLLSGNSGMMRREDLILSEGHAHVVSMGIPAHVPFQELIDSAISYMRRVPPRKLLDLAKRYFDPSHAEPMLKMYPTISLFCQPPSWTWARAAKTDWVLKQRARDRRSDQRELNKLHNRVSSKKDNTIRNHQDNDTEQETYEMVEESAAKLKWPKAYVAAGFGPGIDEVIRQRKRRKLLLIGSAATVAVFAIAIGVSMHVRTETRNQARIQYHEKLAAAREYKAAKNGGSKRDRDEAMPSVQSAGESAAKQDSVTMVPEPATLDRPDVQSLAPVPSECKASENIFSFDISSINRSKPPSNSSSLTNVQAKETDSSLVKNMVFKQLSMLYAKLKLFVRTMKVLNSKLVSPSLRENVHRKLARFFEKLTRTTSPGVREATALASRTVARFTVQALNFTAQQAREHLGGDDLEDLPML